jgi:hypothetical protein
VLSLASSASGGAIHPHRGFAKNDHLAQAISIPPFYRHRQEWQFLLISVARLNRVVKCVMRTRVTPPTRTMFAGKRHGQVGD